MATAHVEGQRLSANVTVGEIHIIAKTLARLNTIADSPVLTVEDRLEVAKAKARCWSVFGNAAEALVSLMDAIAGDPDLEEDVPSGQCDEDEVNTNLTAQWGEGPGCMISDPDAERDGQELETGV